MFNFRQMYSGNFLHQPVIWVSAIIEHLIGVKANDWTQKDEDIRKIQKIVPQKGENVRECDATSRMKKTSSSEESVLPQSKKAVTTERQLSEEDTESDDEKIHVPYFDILKKSLKLPGWNKTTR